MMEILKLLIPAVLVLLLAIDFLLWNQVRTLWKTLRELEELLPRNGGGEIIRNRELLIQMNEEMERGIELERTWNDGVRAILNYGKPKN